MTLADVDAADVDNDGAGAASTLCDPCKDSKACGDDAACVKHGDAGNFCAPTCAKDDDCDDGYTCEDTDSIEDTTATRCVPKPAKDAPVGTFGACTCSAAAQKATLATVCATVTLDTDGKVIGKCIGQRACGDSGLSACDGAAATAEACDGVDNDCDGQTDEDLAAAVCDDKNPCTDAACLSGACTVTANSASCDDGEVCTVKDVCKGGKCAGEKNPCDDGNPCTTGACDLGKGCTSTADDTNPCSDDNACTAGDTCVKGQCFGKNIDCEDNNLCTDDFCDKKTGCANKPNTVTCDDKSACTEKDACAVGLCTGATVDCDDSNPCTNDSCDMATGCTHTNNTSFCDADGDACTVGDFCAVGLCKSGTVTVCNDDNTCTKDSCDTKSGKCVFDVLKDGSDCTDGTVCTKTDTCAKGQCLGKLIVCDDEKLCTVDSCDADKGCVFTDLKDTPCDDNNPCTLKDKCGGGSCQPGTARDCPSADFCIIAKCSPTDGKCGYQNKPAGTPCTDGTKCTEKDACSQGSCVGAALNCDDSNPCTDDSCDLSAGCTQVVNTAGCSDGSKCTVGDTCKAGTCGAGNKKVCDDGNVCTADTCDAQTGDCKFANLETACDDGSKCTKADTCAGGLCIGKAVDCNDGNPCTDDTCTKDKGCQNVANTAPCDDGDKCSDFDKCADKACAGTPKVPAKDCDDGNPCTDDTCAKAVGCQHANNTKACDDGNKCTEGDVCNGGKCNSGGNTCGCQVQSDCNAQEDDNLCNGTLMCQGNKCVINPITIVTCTTGDDGICALNTCTPKTGQCAIVARNESKPCDADNSVCTASDKCVSGKCAAGGVLNCDDGNPCTNDSCDAKKGCQYTANTAACDADNDACTVGDVCSDKLCIVGLPKLCDDLESCTQDSCDKKTGKCEFNGTLRNGQKCDADGSVCTVSDTCADGKCVSGKPRDCDDSNPCTNDSCDNSKGCLYASNTSGCDADGDACTVADVCKDKVCGKGKLTLCDDGNPCTVDQCDTKTGKCVFDGKPQDGKACDADGNVCTDKDACLGGQCLSGKPLNCDDANVCTNDSCDKVKGCQQAVNTAPCNVDDNACTVNDACINTVCKAGTPKVCDDKNPCTGDKCDPKTGACSFTNLKVACDDATKCTSNDLCANGKCAGTPVSCDDNNPCTDDSCDKTAGCANTANTASCSDGNKCTDFDTCTASKCVGTPKVVAKDCVDDNPCTKDACDPTLGCTFTAISGPCEDGDSCTKADSCVAGKCKPGTSVCACKTNADCAKEEDGDLCNGTLVCDKNTCVINPTTIVTCDSSGDTSCQENQCTGKTGKCAVASVNEGKPCDADGSVCTANDKCVAGKCAAGATVSCDDKNVCTDDSCDKVKGCLNGANTAGCDADNNACTVSDTCKDKTCLAGPKKPCDDKNACTVDSCDAKTGDCIYNAVPQEGKACDADGSVCTANDFCKAGVCFAGPTSTCDDGNVCTDDGCDKLTGCTAGPNTKACDADGNACTQGDTCKAKSCVSGTLKVCDDGKACTVDSCETKTGTCVFDSATLQGKGCDADGSVCTVGDACAAGDCKAGAARACDDGNSCTDDSCDKVKGCVNAADTAGCDADGNACTVNDTCKAKSCIAGPLKTCDDGTTCTVDSCDTKTAACTNNPLPQENKVCDADGSVCTVADSCKSGVCTPGSVKVCDDSNVCTNDSCDKSLGCINTANTAGCDADSNLCTVSDACKDKSCLAGPQKDCDDQNLCTVDSCDTTSGTCKHDDKAMNGQTCAQGKKCKNGTCS